MATNPAAERDYRLAEKTLWDTYGIEPTEHWIQLATTGTKVRIQEIGEGEPILFIHGGPNAGCGWTSMVEEIDGYRCLLVDRPGTGLSEPFELTPDNHREVMGRFVSDVLDGLGLESVHVVASSLGGTFALYSAAATPERFRRMVQMAAPAFAPNSPLPPFMRLLSVGWVRALIARLPQNPKATEMILRQIGHGKGIDAGLLPKPVMDWYEELMIHTDTQANDGKVIGNFATFRGFRSENALSDDLFRSVTVPTLFIWGADDGFGGEATARPIVELMPDAELVMLPDTGHLPWFDTAEESTRLSLDYLEREREDA